MSLDVELLCNSLLYINNIENCQTSIELRTVYNCQYQTHIKYYFTVNQARVSYVVFSFYEFTGAIISMFIWFVSTCSTR